MLQAINIAEKLTRFDDHWHPRIIGQVNDFHVKLVKVEGEFVWHHHAGEDELFYVLRGTLRMRHRDAGGEHETIVREGEMIIVPKTMEHMPVAADGEVHLMLLEPASTFNTGTERNERSAEAEWI